MKTSLLRHFTIRFATPGGPVRFHAPDAGGSCVVSRGVRIFAPGETSKTTTLAVNGDNHKEADETLYLDLFGNSSDPLITNKGGIGSILNDD